MTGFGTLDALPHGAGTPFESLPEDWRCPDCGVVKADFEAMACDWQLTAASTVEHTAGRPA